MVSERYKLTYFDVRGAGEILRMLFHYAGVEFEDVRIKEEEWPALKPKTPFGKLPVLTITRDDGTSVELAESCAIARYLARRFKLAGADDLESAQLDAIADAHKDFYNESREFFKVAMGKASSDKERLRKEVFLPALEHRNAFLERALAASTGDGKGFLAHSGVSWVDFLAASITEMTRNCAPDAYKKHPTVVEHMERVHALPQLKAYIAARKPSPM